MKSEVANRPVQRPSWYQSVPWKWQRFLGAVAVIAAAAALRYWPLQALGSRMAWLTFYPSVMVAATYGGLAAGLLATGLACLTVTFLWPVLVAQPFIKDGADWLGMAVFVLTGTMISIVGESTLRADARARQAQAQSAKVVDELTAFKAALDEHAIVAVTDARGKITYVNDKFCAISKYTRDELIGQDHRLINSGHHPKAFIRDLWKTISSGRVWHGEIKNRAKDGTFYWVATTIVPFLDERETPVQYIAIRADITERKQAEEHIAQLNADLQLGAVHLGQANKELDSFAYSVAHDLRAPLRHVHGYVEMLQRATAGQLSEKAQRYVKHITDASAEMGQLIDDLLAFSRMGRAEMREARVDLNALVQDTIRRLEMTTTGRHIVWQVAPLPAVVGDPSMLKQVLANLVENAVKYSRQRDPARIEIGGAGEDDGRAVLFVRDNGAGFDMQYVHKLFGVFQRLHRPEEFEGTGIGLATVQRIVARHGGRVWAEGALDQGATFYFTLKRSPSA
jgi:PAS domain S-box-containing protein